MKKHMSNSKEVCEVSGNCEICNSSRFYLRKITGLAKDKEPIDLDLYERYFLECCNCGEFLDLEYIGENWKKELLKYVDAAIGHCQNCESRHEIESADTDCICGGEIS